MNGYGICSSIDRKTLVDYLNNSSIWSGLATGVENALLNNLRLSSNDIGTVTAKGAPSIELFQLSFNKKYPNVGLEISDNQNLTGATYEGYYLKLNNGEWEYSVDLDNTDKLYFPEKDVISYNFVSTWGYWLARIKRKRR